MVRILLVVPSAPTSLLPVTPHPVVAVAETVVVVVAAVVGSVAAVAVIVVAVAASVTVVAAVASVVVVVAETVAETVAAVVVLQGTGVASAISRGRKRGSIRDEITIPRGIMIMGGRMNRATWVELR